MVEHNDRDEMDWKALEEKAEETPGPSAQAWGMAAIMVAVSGLAGIYVSTLFSGIVTSMLAGALAAVGVFGALLFGLAELNRRFG